MSRKSGVRSSQWTSGAACGAFWSHGVMVAHLFLTQEISVRFRMRPWKGWGFIYCDTNGLSIMGHSDRINVGSNPSSRTEQLAEHNLMWFNRVKRGTFLCPRFRFESEHQNWWSSSWSKNIPLWSRWLWQRSFKSLTRVRVPSSEFQLLRKVEQKLIIEEFLYTFSRKLWKVLCFYSSVWLERPSVKREATSSTLVRNAPEGGCSSRSNWLGLNRELLDTQPRGNWFLFRRDSSDGRAQPLHGWSHGIDARSWYSGNLGSLKPS